MRQSEGAISAFCLSITNPARTCCADGNAEYDHRRRNDKTNVKSFSQNECRSHNAYNRCCKYSERSRRCRNSSVHDGHGPETERRANYAAIGESKRELGGPCDLGLSLKYKSEDSQNTRCHNRFPQHELKRC